MISQLVILFCVTSLMFFLVSLLTKIEYIWFVIPLNVLFLGVSLYSYTQFYGAAIPFQFDIPFWKAQNVFVDKTIVKVKTYFVTESLVHMVVVDAKSNYRYVTFENTPEFLSKFYTAIKDAQKLGRTAQMDIGTDTAYGVNARGTFAELDATQENDHIVKNYDTQVESHPVTGKGEVTISDEKATLPLQAPH